jgi:hypothetical protein
MKNLQNILLENMLRYGVKNLSDNDINRLKLLEQETKEQSLTKRINFASGMHSAEKGNVAGVLGPQLQTMQEFLVANKGSVVEIVLSSSESQVTNYDGETNPKTPLTVGQLSEKRYNTIEAYMTQWLQGLQQQGVITTIPKFVRIPSQIGATPYKQGVDDPRDPKYTAEQWLEVTLKVVADTKPNFTEAFDTIITRRQPNSATSNFNATLFYNLSVAPAAVLNVDPNTLPGAFLTMNTVFNTANDINLGDFKLPKFGATIVADSPKAVPLVVLPNGVSTLNKHKEGTGEWLEYTAQISPTYSINVPFKQGTPEFNNAWLFMYYYIMKSFPKDWNYISNKPTTVDFKVLGNITNISPAKSNSSPEYQKTVWDATNLPDANGNANLTMAQWYRNQVKEFYS